MSKSRETYHTENRESKETEKRKTEKLSTESEKQKNWALIEAQREEKIILKKRKLLYLDAPSRNQQSP